MNTKKIAVLILTALWLFLLGGNFIAAFRYASPRAGLERKALLAGLFLELQEFNRLKILPQSRTIRNQLIENALDSLKDGSPSQAECLSLIYFAQNNPKLAIKTLTVGRKTENSPTLELLSSLLQNRKPPCSLKNAEMILTDNLSGWFLYKSRELLYLRAGDRASLSALRDEFQKKAAGKFYFLLFVSLWLTGGFALGIAALIIYRLTYTGWREKWKNPGWNWIDGWGLFIGAYLLKDIIYLLIFRGVKPAIPLLLVVYLLTNALFIGLIVYFVTRANHLSSTEMGFRFDHWPKQLLLGVSGYWAAIPTVFCLALLSQWLLKMPSFSSNPVIEMVLKRHDRLDEIILLLMVGVIGPFCEEIIFRGFLYPTFRQKLGVFWAVLLTALIFSGLHSDPAGIFPILGLGIILNFLYETSGSILPGFIAHALWNLSVFVFLTRLFG